MTLVAGLRAASYGIPFQPVAGVHGSELARINNWQTLRDPYGSGRDVYVVPAVQPDIAVIHAASEAMRWPTAGRASLNSRSGVSALMKTWPVTGAHV